MMHDDEDRSFDGILLPQQRPAIWALLTIRSEPIGDDVRTSYTGTLVRLCAVHCASL
jgi:hypothetical protein